MMNVLIVDDEIIAVNSLVSRVDWDKFDITNVFTANSADQARKIMLENQVHILLCDIEMPQESGLDLLEWTRANLKDVVCVFLTCHEEFRFVKRALELQSFDYILKPIPYDELESVLERSIAKVMVYRAQDATNHFGALWDINKPDIIEGFWRDLINGLMPLDPDSLGKLLARRNIPLDLEMDFLPVILNILNETPEQKVKRNMGALTAILEEAFSSQGCKLHVCSLSQDNIAVILSYEKNCDAVNLFEIRELCNMALEKTKALLDMDMAGYVGKMVQLCEVPALASELLELRQEHVVRERKVFLLSMNNHNNGFEDIRDISRWKRLFEQQKNEFLISEINRFLNTRKESGKVDRSFLMWFQQDFLQMAYMILQDNGISAHKLFGDKLSIKILEASLQSIDGMLKLVEHTINKSTQYIAEVREPESITEKTKKYIRQNIAEELNRDDLASNVFLNSDYLSRLFKKETGLSLTDYITNERMKMAEEMLMRSDISTYSVAERVGYSSYSYFSKIFRKYFNMSPNEYRVHRNRE